MARKDESRSGARGALGRAASRVRKLFSRHAGAAGSGRNDIETPIATQTESAPVVARPRGRRAEADIPLDRIAAEYLPAQTSLKAGFRSDGADQERDQEFATADLSDRWNDEDRLTNRSGDPRIGTHGRSYEPGERDARAGHDND